MKFEPPPRPRRRPRWGRRLCWMLPLAVAAALVAERWRGQRALTGWLRDMGAQGEVFEARQLWPAPAAASLEFSNQLAQAVGQMPQRLQEYSGRMPGIVLESPGQARRGSQESQPPLEGYGSATNTWQDLETVVREGETALQSLRTTLQNPAPSMDYDVVKRLEEVGFLPNFINVRLAAQMLHAATLSELHRGNLAGALENLEALAAYAKLYEKNPTLVGFMIRIAILGLSDDVCWDALQAEGWSEDQLARLQQACQCDALLGQMPKAMEAERALRISHLTLLRSHAYDDVRKRCEALHRSLGWQTPGSGKAVVVRFWRQWVFHPLWRFAWADQEQLAYLRHIQDELALLREAVRQPSWGRLNARMKAHHQNYRLPMARWRFYGTLPWVESAGDLAGDSGVYPYPDFQRAWLTTLKRLTLHEMVKAVTALNRYKLRHGRWPENLDALTPEFLPAPARDFMDGQALRYRLRPDGSFLLYSIGEDMVDGQGDLTPASPPPGGREISPWEGRDWVWPQMVPARR